MERTNIVPGRKRLKGIIVKFIFWFLGRAFQAASKFDDELKSEIEHFSDSTSIMLNVMNTELGMVIEKSRSGIIYKGSFSKDASLSINFKSMEGALLVLTGREGIPKAYAEHRFTVKGDISTAIAVVRCFSIVETYLFPGFITRSIIKKIHKKQTSSIKIYAAALFGLR